jgi:hypothetical protein
MKKIPTLFERVFENHNIKETLPNVTPGCEFVLEGKGIATEKIDGSCCAIINGKFYKRYDAKHGKKAPEGAIPCCEPDPITGHHPHWILVDKNKPEDKWFVEAFLESQHFVILKDGTYEAIGPHFQGNPYEYTQDFLMPHGENILDVPRTFEGIKEYLRFNCIEGIVFWLDGEPKCKIKRSDFGFEWNKKENK